MLTYEASTPKRARMHRIRSADYCVHEWGRPGDPLLLVLHGWGDTGAAFQFMVDKLADAWFVVAPDWRGFGNSSWNSEAYWFPDYLADLHALLAIYSPDHAAMLAGHSMGANIASLYAGVFPERVAALVNIEGFGLADSDPGAAPANYRRFVEASGPRSPHPGYADFAALVPRIRKLGNHIDDAHASYVARLWARSDESGRVVLRADPAHRWPNAVQYRRPEALACWRRVTAPVLLVTGSETRVAEAATPWLHEDAAALPFPDVVRLTIPAAGHMIHFEQPGPLAAAVEAFLQQRSRLVNPSSTV